MPLIHFTQQEVARAVGRTPRTIKSHLEKFQIEPDGQRLDGTRLYSAKRVLELFDKQKTMRGLSEACRGILYGPPATSIANVS